MIEVAYRAVQGWLLWVTAMLPHWVVQRWLTLSDNLRYAELSANSPCAKQSTAPEDAILGCRSLRRIQSAGSPALTCWKWRPHFILQDICHQYMRALLHLLLYFRWVPAVLPPA